MSMHMIHGVRAPGSGKKKPKAKTASVLAAEKALRDTLARVGYKGGSKVSRKGYVHDLGVTHTKVTSDKVPGNGSKKETVMYTGDELMGVALLHKQAYEPVRKDNKQSAVDIARMRR